MTKVQVEKMNDGRIKIVFIREDDLEGVILNTMDAEALRVKLESVLNQSPE